MISTLITSDTDPIGRMDESMLTDQQRMEMLFIPRDPQHAHEQLKDDEDDACSWEGVQCNSSGTLYHISWHVDALLLRGTVRFEMFPSQLTLLEFYEQALYGEMNIENLPDPMQVFWVERCMFKGTLDFGHLPRQMEMIIITQNRITSVVNMCNLPATLQKIKVSESRNTEKSIRIAKMPNEKLIINLIDCGFTEKVMEDSKDRCRVVIRR